MEHVSMTREQYADFALLAAKYAIEHMKTPVKEPSYKTTDPKIQEYFPGTCPRTLREWCKSIGKRKGADGHYRVKLSEIERSYQPTK
jgi:hypothetical protein